MRMDVMELLMMEVARTVIVVVLTWGGDRSDSDGKVGDGAAVVWYRFLCCFSHLVLLLLLLLV